MLELVGLTHAFGPRPVLDGVTFEVRPGEVVGLLGPNGAGKTTLMRILFGVISPDAGSVRWQGRPATADDRRSWGYMTQERALYKDMSAIDQIVYLGRLHGMTREAAGDAARELLGVLGLADRSGERVDKLSGGMQQRVQMATALVHDPEVVVLDEPFSGLDPVAVDYLSSVITDRASSGRTVVFSSHQLDLVEDLCDSIVLIDRGRIVLEGRLRDLQEQSGQRQLRVRVEADDDSWLEALDGVDVVHRDASGQRLSLPAGTDPLAVLDAARAAGPVTDFGLDLPSLTQLFLDAVGRDRFEVETEGQAA